MTSFDYGGLSPEIAEWLRQHAAQISEKKAKAGAIVVKDYIDIGRDLLAVKHLFTDDEFFRWLEAECRIDIQAAQNYMNAAEFAENPTNRVVLALHPAVVYQIAAKSTPPEVAAEIMRRAKGGEIDINSIEVENLIAKAKRKE
jgi:Protein of unknown function (DUF3102)